MRFKSNTSSTLQRKETVIGSSTWIRVSDQPRRLSSANRLEVFPFERIPVSLHSAVAAVCPSLHFRFTRRQVKSFVFRNRNPPCNSFALGGQSLLALLAVKSVRAALVPRSALNNFAARNGSQAFHCCTSPPRARCLTFALPPDGGGPGRLLRFSNVAVGGPLTTRARVGRFTTSHVSTQSHRPGRSNVLARAGQASKVCRYRGNLNCNLVALLLGLEFSFQHLPLGLTESRPAPWGQAQASALFGPRTITDSPVCDRSTPLHDPLR